MITGATTAWAFKRLAAPQNRKLLPHSAVTVFSPPILIYCIYVHIWTIVSLQLCAYNQSTLFNVYSIPSISNFTISISSSISLRLCSEYPTYNNVSKNPFDNLLRKLYSSSCRIAEVYQYGRWTGERSSVDVGAVVDEEEISLKSMKCTQILWRRQSYVFQFLFPNWFGKRDKLHIFPSFVNERI